MHDCYITNHTYLKRSLILLVIPFLSACAGIGIQGAEAIFGATVILGTGAIVSNDKEKAEIKVYGNYKNGFWFDRELYNVWVVANLPEEAEQVAMDTATNACAQRERQLKIINTRSWQEGSIFVRLDRFSHEIRFRCSLAQ